MNTTPATNTDGATGTAAVDTVIIGAGQSGLALGYYLARQQRNFVILDAETRVGDAWRNRWDSLRLFTPAKYDGLPGLPFPGDPLAFPIKDEQADYLQDYAARFQLPVKNNSEVSRGTHDGQRFHVAAGTQRWTAANVVLATGACLLPRTPRFAADLPADVVQLQAAGRQRHLVHRLHRGLPVAGHPGTAGGLAEAAAPRIVDALPGLYLLGKHQIFAAASESLPGVCRDAKYLAKHLAAARVPEEVEEVLGVRAA